MSETFDRSASNLDRLEAAGIKKFMMMKPESIINLTKPTRRITLDLPITWLTKKPFKVIHLNAMVAHL